jgi:toxin-antitoxin system PIN domain toxin
MSTCYLPDVNVWFALSRSEHMQHEQAHAWLSTIDAPKSVAFTRATQQGYLRLLTTAAVMRIYASAPLTNSEAWHLWESWYKDDRIHWTEEPSELVDSWKKFGAIRSASPKHWMDSYLAAIAKEARYQLVTLDQAFKGFKGLDVHLIA